MGLSGFRLDHKFSSCPAKSNGGRKPKPSGTGLIPEPFGKIDEVGGSIRETEPSHKVVGMMKYTFLRFLLVGMINTIIGLSVMFLCLKGFHCSYWFSTFSGNVTGLLVSFFLNRRFTFQSQIGTGTGILKFFLMAGVSYLFSFYVGLEFSERVARGFPVFRNYTREMGILTGSGLYSGLNFWGQKYFVFQQGRIKGAKRFGD